LITSVVRDILESTHRRFPHRRPRIQHALGARGREVIPSHHNPSSPMADPDILSSPALDHTDDACSTHSVHQQAKFSRFIHFSHRPQLILKLFTRCTGKRPPHSMHHPPRPAPTPASSFAMETNHRIRDASEREALPYRFHSVFVPTADPEVIHSLHSTHHPQSTHTPRPTTTPAGDFVMDPNHRIHDASEREAFPYRSISSSSTADPELISSLRCVGTTALAASARELTSYHTSPMTDTRACRLSRDGYALPHTRCTRKRTHPITSITHDRHPHLLALSRGTRTAARTVRLQENSPQYFHHPRPASTPTGSLARDMHCRAHGASAREVLPFNSVAHDRH
jgi:hypothetical protein